MPGRRGKTGRVRPCMSNAKQMMRCPRCHISVKSYYSYCPNCGARLGFSVGLPGGILLLLFMIVLVLFIAYRIQAGRGGINGPSSPKKVDAHVFTETGNRVLPMKSVLATEPERRSSNPVLPVGTVVIHDIAGNEISRFQALVAGSGWIAIPARRCIGGYRWYFYTGTDKTFEISGGIIGDKDDVGIWQIDYPDALTGPPIFPAKPGRPMVWRSIISDKEGKLSGPRILSEEENFDRIFLSRPVIEPSVIIQDNHIIGWIFGKASKYGYLWKGPDDSDLVCELSVNDFYRLTFEGGREEQFILAYARSGADPAYALEIFAGGFKRKPKMAADDTPFRLRPAAVIKKMRRLTLMIMDQGAPDALMPLFDASVLSNTGDADFIIFVMKLCEQLKGSGFAAGIMEEILSETENFDKIGIGLLMDFQGRLYQHLLLRLMEQKEYDTGLRLYRRIVERGLGDPKICLLAARMALGLHDWKTAAQIINSMQFPLDMDDQVQAVLNRISDLRHEGDKIVIRFHPGSDRIPVTGLIDNRIQQDFIVDTGASMVTIPMAAAKNLGIEINDHTPVEKLVTAGGVVSAPRIVLPSLSIKGWTEYNVTAYVLDMPDRSGYGLLGLDFLKRFQINMNTREGVLTLTPR